MLRFNGSKYGENGQDDSLNILNIMGTRCMIGVLFFISCLYTECTVTCTTGKTATSTLTCGIQSGAAFFVSGTLPKCQW